MNTIIRTYSGITPAYFAQLDEEAESLLGMNLSGNAGQASAHGVTISWSYSPDAQILTFSLVSKPFYVPMGVLQDHLDQLIHGQATATSVT